MGRSIVSMVLRASIPRASRFVAGALAGSVFAAAGCSSSEGSAPASSARSVPSGAPASAAAPELAPSAYDPTPCAVDAAPGIVATATFSRRADGKTDVVVELAAPNAPVSYDANGVPRVFGAGRGEPTVKHDGAALELRSEVTFSSNPYVTFIVPIHCGDQRGAVSVSASWESAETEPGKQLSVETTAFH